MLGTGRGGIEMDWEFILNMLVGLTISITTGILWCKWIDIFEKKITKANKEVNRKD